MKILNLLNNKLLVFIFILTSFHCKAQWNAVYELDSTVFLGMHFTSDSVGYVVGYRINALNYSIGQVLKTIDGGNHWNKIYEASTPQTPNPASYPDFNCVYFPTPNIGYIGSDYSIILKTSDAGQTWITQTVPEFSFDTRMIYCTDSLTCFAGKALMFKTFDGGLNWALDSNASPVDDVSFLSPNRGYGLWSNTIDGGNNWSPQFFPIGLSATYRTIFFINDSTGWAGGIGQGGSPNFNFGTIAKTIDYGQTWQQNDFQYEMLQIRDIFFINDSVGWACGNGQSGNSRQIMKTVDGGLNWHKQFLNYTTNYSAVTQMQCLNDSLCYAISGWQIFKTTNGGGPMIGLGETENENFKNLSIYPNPGNDRIYLNGVKENCSITFYNSLGQIQNLSSSIDVSGLDISSLEKGFYMYLINDQLNGKTKTGKFIKQ
jgi:photosystem II stability/assembly factor-like uncharacterized protein